MSQRIGGIGCHKIRCRAGLVPSRRGGALRYRYVSILPKHAPWPIATAMAMADEFKRLVNMGCHMLNVLALA